MKERPPLTSETIGKAASMVAKFTEAQFLGRYAELRGPAVLAGGGTALDRFLVRLAERRGHVSFPPTSTGIVRRK